MASILEVLSAPIPAAGPILKAIFGSAVIILGITQKCANDHKTLRELTFRVGRLVVLIQEKLVDPRGVSLAGEPSNPTRLGMMLEDLLKLLREIEKFFLKFSSQSKVKRFLKTLKRTEKMEGFTKRLTQFQQDISILALVENLHRGSAVTSRKAVFFLIPPIPD